MTKTYVIIGAVTTFLREIALYNDTARTLTSSEGPVRLTGLAATPNLFDVLGTSPLIGRTFGLTIGTSARSS